MLTPVGFANAVIQKLHEYQLSAPGRAAAAARPPLDSPSRPAIAATEPSLLSLTRDRAERESRPTCPDCKLRDCPRAKAATDPCDIHSPLTAARLEQIVQSGNKTYLEIVIRKRAKTEMAAAPAAASPSTSALTASTSERDDALAAQMAALETLTSGV